MMIKKLIKKILNNLIRPHKVPKKILNKLNYYFKCKKYNKVLYEKEQNDFFNQYGLDRKKGIEKLNFVKKELAKNFDINRGMASEHEVFFASLLFGGWGSFEVSNCFPFFVPRMAILGRQRCRDNAVRCLAVASLWPRRSSSLSKKNKKKVIKSIFG